MVTALIVICPLAGFGMSMKENAPLTDVPEFLCWWLLYLLLIEMVCLLSCFRKNAMHAEENVSCELSSLCVCW